MKRSKFSLSNYKLFSCDMGQLIPCGLLEVLPGDTIQQSTSALVRLSPLLAPVMHPVHVRIHHWFVPHRLVWNDWEDFITGGPDGMDATAFPVRNFAAGFPTAGTLPDYLGVPPGTAGGAGEVNALPIRGYNLIFNEWYRDQDLVSERAISMGSTDASNIQLAQVAWEKDYFTSARPWEQKGPAITIPIGDFATVNFEEIGATPQSITVTRDTALAQSQLEVQETGTANAEILGIADLSTASAVTVTRLREAMALQRYEEARARYGSRYTEYLRYLGVKASDQRLQRPEYLGGGQQTIQFSEVLQTAPSAPDVVGEMRGHGIGAMRSNRYRRFFEEHGYIFTLLSVKPRTMYTQGLYRTWNRRTKEDFWQKELQHIGQQEVLNKEVYVAHTNPEGVFGYQDRYDEYRRQESSIAGEFRDTTLNYWHMARDFSSDPALNSDFVQSNPTNRIFAVNTKDTLYIMAHHSIQARRMVAKTGKSYIY